MKKAFILILSITSLFTNAQNVGIGVANPQNKLHVGGGFRLDTLTGINGAGLLRHDANGVVYGIKFSGNITDVLRGDGTFGPGGTGSVGWLLSGNSGTNSSSNFIGTTDTQPLIFKINNVHSGILDSAVGNTSFGYKSNYNLGGFFNTSFGFRSLLSDTTGFSNTAIGGQALQFNGSGGNNSAVGVNSLRSNTNGSNNSALGFGALGANTSGNNNSAFGYGALASNRAGYSNIAIGIRALINNISTSNLVAVGDSALLKNTGGAENTAIGSKALYTNVLGSKNTAIGFETLYFNTSGANSALGYFALRSNTTGANNTATGNNALQNNSVGFQNTANGSNALANNNDGRDNTSAGNGAMYLNQNGNYNTAVGSQALYNNNAANNTGVGYNALLANTGGTSNTAVGYGTMQNLTTGHWNTALGTLAGPLSNNLNNTVAIGFNAFVNVSNKVRIGNSAITVIEGQVAYTFPSDGRFKTNVTETIKGLEFIMKLRPVAYNFQTSKYDAFINGDTKFTSAINYTESEALRHNGFIAQEVEKAARESGYDFDGVIAPKSKNQTYGLSYSQFVVPLVKAVQEQQSIIEKQQKLIDELLNRVAALEKK